MSLRPDDHRSSRSRSKSPGRSRSRSRSDAAAGAPIPRGPAFPNDPSSYQPSFAQPHVTSATPQYEVRQPFQQAPGLSSYITPGALLGGGGAAAAATTAEPRYQRTPSPSLGSGGMMAQEMAMGQQGITMGGYTDLPPNERPGYVQHGRQASGQYAQQQPQWSYSATPVNSNATPQSPVRNMSGGSYTQAGQFQYAQPDGLKYTARPVTAQTAAPPPPSKAAHSMPRPGAMEMPEAAMFAPPPPPPPKQKKEKEEKYDPYLAYGQDNARVVEMKPSGGGNLGAPPSPGLHPRLSIHTPRADLRAPSPGLAPRMDRLSVSGNRPDLHNIMPGGLPGGNLPPPSPLLEAYHGTYQSLSPMPSPMMLPHGDADLDDLPPLEPRLTADDRRSSKKGHVRRRSSSNASRGKGHSHSASSSSITLSTSKSQREKDVQKAGSKRVKIYDGEQDASDIVKALSSSSNPDTAVLIDILPHLTHDQMLDLRAAYKRLCKIHGRGINIAKHLKLKLPTSTHFGKIVYVTALGRWESEAYWANYWYQAQTSKRELLIEALFSRQNYEIAAIKDAFRDKRYGDSLTRCAEKELRADKFRTAVLMVLEGDRQEEEEVWPAEYRERDVDALARAVGRREGGESEILRICVGRSDAHLRECLRLYERRYGGNFAREALRKSGNLVGEVVAHILNGVINRPARDAMLLHHALVDLIENPSVTTSTSSTKHDRQHRHELLISRLVRLHWDRSHLARVRIEYRDKYGDLLEEDVEEATRGDFGDFCLGVCGR